MSYAVELHKLSRHFGSFKAVDEISLNVSKGEIFGFLGANGAGKTTAIRMLCGLLLPTSGNGKVAGCDIINESEKIKTKIGYMSQKFSLYGELTGLENINFYGTVYGMNKKDIKNRLELLTDKLELDEFLKRQAHSLPIGWRQRLALAVALLHQPKLLFLDEPTGGVDPIFRRKFWSVLYGLAEEGVTIFVTTHYMDEAEYCGRISIMHQGKIIEIGKPFELVEKYKAENLEQMFIDLINCREVNNA
ncbi:MAG TPA: ABC transporter ATP-binding protein [candidate division Zixibacteria bacterium]|nr:ABC transporter ATP-binding protein [candidate division Zixibacteria bacterium]